MIGFANTLSSIEDDKLWYALSEEKENLTDQHYQR